MPAAQTIELRPNCALTPRSARCFFASLCAATLAVAAPFTLRGLWPILPFAAVEMLALGWALHAALARRHQRQSLTITDDSVAIDSQLPPRSEHVVFSRHWTHAKLRRAASPWHPGRLTLESHGRACEVGAFLTEEERRGLARRLQRLVGRMSESPPMSESATQLRSA